MKTLDTIIRTGKRIARAGLAALILQNGSGAFSYAENRSHSSYDESHPNQQGKEEKFAGLAGQIV